MEDLEDTRTYIVIINTEEQYSLWPKDKNIPKGWHAVGKEGTQQECCEYVDQVWTDMRPKSLRLKMQQIADTEGGVRSEVD